MNQKLHLKIHIPSQTSLKIDHCQMVKKKFNHHLTNPKIAIKNGPNTSWAIEIHNHHLMVTKFSCCCWMATKFSHHAIVEQKLFGHHPHVVMENLLITITCGDHTFRSPQCLSPPPHPLFFSFFTFPL
jgi:hypothetical protein